MLKGSEGNSGTNGIKKYLANHRGIFKIERENGWNHMANREDQRRHECPRNVQKSV